MQEKLNYYASVHFLITTGILDIKVEVVQGTQMEKGGINKKNKMLYLN